MITAVVDTNVLVSGFAGYDRPSRAPAQIIRAWRSGGFELIVSAHILGEVEHTFQEPYFRRRLTPEQILRASALLRRRATAVPITIEIHGVATHQEDDVVLSTALSALSQYLVSGDKKLQKLGTYQGVTIVSPREFLEILARGNSED